MNKKLKSNTGLRYEITDKPFWGPKRYAIAALKEFSGNPISNEEYCEYLKENYPKHFLNIEWIRFHDYNDRSFPKNKFSGRMRLAIFNTSAHVKSRDIFFNERNKITKETGWYPLIMGSRCRFWNYRIKSINQITIKSIGKILNFTPISNSSRDGISFELKGSKGKYLLDFGFNGNVSQQYDCHFLSHTHSDHSGGINNVVSNNRNDAPIISSKTGASFLIHKLRNTNTENICHTGFNTKIILDDGFEIEFIRVFHNQGSIGFRFTDPFGTSVYYFGDVCLRNGFSDYRNQLKEFIVNTKTKKNVIIFDGAMIGRKLFIDKEDTPEKILNEFALNSETRNLIFFSNQPENSIYSFLKVYRITQQIKELKSLKLLVSTSLMPTLRHLIEPIIFNFDDYKDPVFRTLFGSHKSNPVESHRLYPLTNDTLNQVAENERIVIFSGINDIRRISKLRNRFLKADVILAGTFALRENLPDELVTTRPRTIIRVASEDWSFHSNESDIADFIEEVDSTDTKIYLFHNYFNRLINFINQNGFESSRIRALGDRYNTIRV